MIADGSITAEKLINNAVTTGKILDGSVSMSKLASAVVEYLLPVGSLVATVSGTAAPGFLLADASAVSRGTYATSLA